MHCLLYSLQGDGRPFWKFVVSEATGCGDEDFFEEVYEVTYLVLFYLSFVHFQSTKIQSAGANLSVQCFDIYEVNCNFFVFHQLLCNITKNKI